MKGGRVVGSSVNVSDSLGRIQYAVPRSMAGSIKVDAATVSGTVTVFYS